MKAQVKILRSDPKTGRKAKYVTYTIPVASGDKVLGGLLYIYKNIDPCLSFRFNCRGRHCGECSMMINGKPGLSCAVPMPREVTLEPLRNLPLIKDLVIDRNGVYRSVLSHLPLQASTEGGNGTGLRPVPAEVIDRLVRIDECIQCLCCMAVCPVYRKQGDVFPGPLGLLAFATDTGEASLRAGVEKAAMCVECGQCEKVCPRNIPLLSEAIEGLKRG